MYIIHLVCGFFVVAVVVVQGAYGVCGARYVCCVVGGDDSRSADETPVRQKMFRFGARCGVM